MVPRTSILHSSPGVVKSVVRSGRTLSYAINAVHVHSPPLSNPVPMNTSAIVLKLVVDKDCDILAILLAWRGPISKIT